MTPKTNPQTTIHGVLVHRTPTPAHPKYHFRPYPIPAASLHPGTFSPPIPFLTAMLPAACGLRILYTQPPTPSTPTSTHIPLDFRSFLFGYWSLNLRQHPALTSRMVFFRQDLRPLEPRQCAVLWAFCECVVRSIYVDVLELFPWGGAFGCGDGGGGGGGTGVAMEEVVVAGMQRLWVQRAGVDCLYAWGRWHRNEKLLRGWEEWRGVVMLYDDDERYEGACTGKRWCESK